MLIAAIAAAAATKAKAEEEATKKAAALGKLINWYMICDCIKRICLIIL